jgi:hypothetical protein
MPIESAPKDGTRILAACPLPERFDLLIAWFGRDWNALDIANDGVVRFVGHVRADDPPLWLSGDGDGFSAGYYFTPCKPTHWMPLPPPPEEV